MIKKATQSFIKSMRAYEAGRECGHIIEAQWFSDRILDMEEEGEDEQEGINLMQLGMFFEYQAFRTLPKSGVAPLAQFRQNGDMRKPYERADVNAKLLKKYLKTMGLEVVSVGKKFTKKYKQHPDGLKKAARESEHEGTVDLIVRVTKPKKFANGIHWKKGDLLVIDLKYSGLLGNRWNRNGWAWSDDQKEYHGTQAKQYHLITGLPFYFWVTNAKNDKCEWKLFHVPVTETMIRAHVNESNSLMDALKIHAEVGDLVARPEVTKCGKCPLAGECKDKHLWPHPELIDITFFKKSS